MAEFAISITPTMVNYVIREEPGDAFASLLADMYSNERVQKMQMPQPIQMVNFFRMELRPSSDPKLFKPYPMIEDGGAYLVMHTRGQPATKAAMQVRAPGVKWQHAAERMAYYGLTTDKISAKMREILASGIQIMNLKDLQVEFKKLKKQKFRNAETEK